VLQRLMIITINFIASTFTDFWETKIQLYDIEKDIIVSTIVNEIFYSILFL
jgi:hypothetical protein